MSRRYAIKDRAGAIAYLAHPVLEMCLTEISQEVFNARTTSATQIMRSPDDFKLRSSMTLFSLVPDADPVFENILKKFFDDKKDPATLQLLH